MNDKPLIVGALLTIAIAICFLDVTPESVNIINNIVSGLLGMAVGQLATKK